MTGRPAGEGTAVSRGGRSVGTAAAGEPGAAGKLLMVLLSFERAPSLRIADLTTETGLPKATVHRLLGDLRSHGLVEKTASGRYQLGYRAWRLGRIARPYDALRRAAHPLLVRLSEESRESTFLTAREDLDSICIDRVEAPQMVRMSLEVDTAVPLHLGASNRILLAFLSDDEAHDVVSRLDLDTGEREDLVVDLARIRGDGWVYTTAQLTPGAAAIAVPVRGTEGGLIAGLSIGGPVDRFAPDAARRVLPSLLSAAEAAAGALKNIR